MFALAASNMILRGDGKANLHQSSCFMTDFQDLIKNPKPETGLKRPNVGFQSTLRPIQKRCRIA